MPAIQRYSVKVDLKKGTMMDVKLIDTMTCEELDHLVIEALGRRLCWTRKSSPTSDLNDGCEIMFAHEIDISHISNRTGEVVAQMRGSGDDFGKVISIGVANRKEGKYPALIAAMRCLLKAKAKQECSLTKV